MKIKKKEEPIEEEIGDDYDGEEEICHHTIGYALIRLNQSGI